jgi:type IV pilus assembly protein PilM
LDATVIDVDFFALSNAYEASYGIKGDENIALLDIGSNKALMNIISRGVPLFTRGISMGGSQITDGIRDHFKLSQEDAERVKLEGGGTKCPAAELEMIFVGVVKKWVGEFRRAIDFFYNNFPDSRIDKLYLCGGSCRIPGLDKVFQENADADVEIFNPLTRLNYDANGFDPDYIHYVGPQMAIALGLALRKTRER